MHGRPPKTAKKLIYYAWLPGSKADYVGQSVLTLYTRKMKHRDDLNRQNSSRGLDRLRATLAKHGFNRALMHALADLDQVDPVRAEMRLYEYKGFVLLEPSQNTQRQQVGLEEPRFVQ